MCYTYDNLNRVTKRTIKNLSNVVLSEESFTYDAAGNITDAPESCFQYDTNNRLVVFNGNSVSSNETQADVIIKCKCCKSTLAVNVAQDFFVIEHMRPPQRTNQNNT